jgi:putative membrane protein
VDSAYNVPLADTWAMHGDIGTGWWIVMVGAMVVFWGAIILGVVWLLRGAFDRWPARRRETPTEILERRFAEGAISAEEYQERREILAGETRSVQEGSSDAERARASDTSGKAQP